MNYLYVAELCALCLFIGYFIGMRRSKANKKSGTEVLIELISFVAHNANYLLTLPERLEDRLTRLDKLLGVQPSTRPEDKPVSLAVEHNLPDGQRKESE
jgi:hypothetical protein